jgi:hypothetical protein
MVVSCGGAGLPAQRVPDRLQVEDPYGLLTTAVAVP